MNIGIKLPTAVSGKGYKMVPNFEEREQKYNDAVIEQDMLMMELDELDEGTDTYDRKIGRINELGKITGVFW